MNKRGFFLSTVLAFTISALLPPSCGPSQESRPDRFLPTAGTQPAPNSPVPADSTMTFTGTILSGAQLGELKSYCQEGLYLVADDGSYLVHETTLLLLRVPHPPGAPADPPKMFSGSEYISKRVEVGGDYPAQQVFCEALICTCEDFILLRQIKVLEASSEE